MLIEIRATFECDECGQRFSVAIDPPEGPTAFEAAEEGCRIAKEYQGDGDDLCGSNVVNGAHLCAVCAYAEDSRRHQEEASEG